MLSLYLQEVAVVAGKSKEAFRHLEDRGAGGPLVLQSRGGSRCRQIFRLGFMVMMVEVAPLKVLVLIDAPT